MIDHSSSRAITVWWATFPVAAIKEAWGLNIFLKVVTISQPVRSSSPQLFLPQSMSPSQSWCSSQSPVISTLHGLSGVQQFQSLIKCVIDLFTTKQFIMMREWPTQVILPAAERSENGITRFLGWHTCTGSVEFDWAEHYKIFRVLLLFCFSKLC